jgi:uncharacterized protein (DUF885 family)
MVMLNMTKVVPIKQKTSERLEENYVIEYLHYDIILKMFDNPYIIKDNSFSEKFKNKLDDIVQAKIKIVEKRENEKLVDILQILNAKKLRKEDELNAQIVELQNQLKKYQQSSKKRIIILILI